MGKTKVYVIPKRNATLNGSKKRKDNMKDFVENRMQCLQEYHQRCNSESGFSEDEKIPGWNIAQRRDYRMDNARSCTGVRHNLLNMGRFWNCAHTRKFKLLGRKPKALKSPLSQGFSHIRTISFISVFSEVLSNAYPAYNIYITAAELIRAYLLSHP